MHHPRNLYWASALLGTNEVPLGSSYCDITHANTTIPARRTEKVVKKAKRAKKVKKASEKEPFLSDEEWTFLVEYGQAMTPEMAALHKKGMKF